MQCSENSDSYQKAAAYNIFENISMHVPKRSLKYSPKNFFPLPLLPMLDHCVMLQYHKSNYFGKILTKIVFKNKIKFWVRKQS